MASGAAAVAVTVGLVVSQSGGSPASSSHGNSSLPSWLPKASVPVGRVVTASPSHPWLAIEGDAVEVHLAEGRALVTAVGPAVPEEGQFPVPATTSCTFTMTLTKVAGDVPLRAQDFSITDELDHVDTPTVTLQGGGAVPVRAPHHGTLTLSVSAVLPTGSGSLHWSPGGGRPVVSWDFDVEID